MSGEFFDPRPPKPHECKPPPPWSALNSGWRCECGKAYVREALSARDINEGEDPYQWRRAPEFDKVHRPNPTMTRS